MKEVNAPLAGEMSGHIFFSDRYFGFDDAIYAAIRLIDVVNRQGKKLSTIRSALPSVINTPELRLPCEGKNKFLMIEYFTVQQIKDPKTGGVKPVGRALVKDFRNNGKSFEVNSLMKKVYSGNFQIILKVLP